MSVHLNRKELKLLRALDKAYPGGIERTSDLLESSNRLEDMGLAEVSTVGAFKSGVRITTAGKQYVREEKANRRSLLGKIAVGIVTLILIPVLVNLVSDYVLPAFFRQKPADPSKQVIPEKSPDSMLVFGLVPVSVLVLL